MVLLIAKEVLLNNAILAGEYIKLVVILRVIYVRLSLSPSKGTDVTRLSLDRFKGLQFLRDLGLTSLVDVPKFNQR
jgi:hypothetical protein